MEKTEKKTPKLIKVVLEFDDGHKLIRNKKDALPFLLRIAAEIGREQNCLEKNPCVEKYYSGLTKEQRLAEIDSCVESILKILSNLLDQRNEILKA